MKIIKHNFDSKINKWKAIVSIQNVEYVVVIKEFYMYQDNYCKANLGYRYNITSLEMEHIGAYSQHLKILMKHIKEIIENQTTKEIKVKSIEEIYNFS